MRRLAALAAVLATLVSVEGVEAQFAPGARSVGMGGAGMVFGIGVDAAELNPANLAFSSGWNVSVFEVGAAGLNSGATLDEIAAIFGADVLGSADLNVAQVVNGLPDEGIGLSLVAEGFMTSAALEAGDLPRPGSPLPSIGLAVGHFSLRVRSRVFTDLTMSKELADLIGNGFSEQRIQEYAVGNTGYRTMAFSEITGAYGTTLGGLLSIGVAGRYVQGHSLMDGRFFEPELDLTSAPNTLSVTSVAVESGSGTGYAMDFGLSLDLPLGFRVGASGRNVLQRMTWDEALTSHTATYSNDDIDQNDFIDLLDFFDSQPITSNQVSLPVLQASQQLFEESYFPATYSGGVGFQTGGTALELVGIVVSPRGRQRNQWDERISLGIEQKIPVVTFRAGLARAQDGLQAVTGGLGLALGPVHLEGSGGVFSGDATSTVYDGGYATLSLQIKGG